MIPTATIKFLTSLALRTPPCQVNTASSSGVAAEKRAPSQPLPGDEIKPLSGNLYYDVILPNSAVGSGHYYNMGPVASLKLPSAEIPTVLNCRGKSWDMMYLGRSVGRKFNCGGWKKFAEDNCLKVGDACIFELMERSREKLVFDVQILGGDIPSIFLDREETIGNSAEDPIIID